MNTMQIVLQCQQDYLDVVIGAVNKDRNVQIIEIRAVYSKEDEEADSHYIHHHRTPAARHRAADGQTIRDHILAFLKERKLASREDITRLMKSIGVNPDSSSPAISTLKKGGFLYANGDFYEITEKGKTFTGKVPSSQKKKE